MALRRPPYKRVLATFGIALLLGLLLYMVADADSFLRRLFSGLPDKPLSETRLVSMLASYGYWIFVGYVIITALALFLENRNPDRTLAWLLILGLVPVAGLALYWVVGPNFRYLADKRRFRLPKPRPSPDVPQEKLEDPLVARTATLLYRSGGARLFPDTRAELTADGEETVGRMLRAMARARKSIFLETYILGNDTLGNIIKGLLIHRARAGLDVYLIYDAVGSWRIGPAFLRALRQGGVKAYPFLPVAFPMFRGANYRNHRKILVVDGTEAFIGGMNLNDDCLGKNPCLGYWRDTHLHLHGGAVQALTQIFLRDLTACGAPAEELTRLRQSVLGRNGADKESGNGQVLAQVAASGPDTAWDTIEKAYISLISRARERVWVTTPYLVPGDTLLDTLCAASLSGVDVRMLIPGRGDHRLSTWASLNTCEELLRAGVRVFLYRKDRFIHAKTVVCDGQVLSVGSANMDTRSLQINFEAQVFLYDQHLARQGEELFEKDMQNAEELSFVAWRARPLTQRVRESIGKLFSSLA